MHISPADAITDEALEVVLRWVRSAEAGDFFGCWRVMDDNLRLCTVQTWMTGLGGADELPVARDAIAADLGSISSTHELRPAFERAALELFGRIMRLGRDAYVVGTQRRQPSSTLEQVVLFRRDALGLDAEQAQPVWSRSTEPADDRPAILFTVRHGPGRSQLATVGDATWPPVPGWPPAPGRPSPGDDA